MDLKFRDLRADEIEVRVATVSEKGVSLLLYKNARCDMNILDETVGALNWQRDHKELKGNMYCGIGIYSSDTSHCDTAQWIWKWDCGAESYTEKEKGEASDSFKRAGFNWGIGRELYTAPFIWVNASDCKIDKDSRGKFVCKDRFAVTRLEVENKTITSLIIVSKSGQVVFKMGIDNPPRESPQVFCPDCGIQILKLTSKSGRVWTPEQIMKRYGKCEACYKKEQLEKIEKAVNEKTI